MKKLISLLTVFSIFFSTAAFGAELEPVSSFSTNTELVTSTPTGGILLEEGTVSDSLSAEVSFKSSGNLSGNSEQSFDEYLREEIINHKTTINVSAFKIPVSEFSSKYFAFVFCNSDLPIRTAYTGGVSFTQNGIRYMQSINPVYVYSTKAECDRKYIELDKLTTELAEYASKGKTEAEKALFLFDKISLDYYYTPGETFQKINYTPYSFLDNGHAVCQGYASLYKLALEKLNIESYVCGNMNTSVNHAWNYIKIDGKWYHADPTWSYYVDAPDKISRKYFLLSDATMLADGKHGIKSEWILQTNGLSSVECTDNEYATGYLFHEFIGDPIYRDNSSLYLNCDIASSNLGVLNLKLRNDTLQVRDVILSEPDTINNQTTVCALTLKQINKEVAVIISGYEGNGKFVRCAKLTADNIPEYSCIPFPTLGLDEEADTVKWMFVDATTFSPLAFYSTLK